MVDCTVFDHIGNRIAEKQFSGDVPDNSSVSCGDFVVDTPADGNGFTLELSARLNGEETNNSYLFLRDIDGLMDREVIAAYVLTFPKKPDIIRK